jgi:hypothetical protein
MESQGLKTVAVFLSDSLREELDIIRELSKKKMQLKSEPVLQRWLFPREKFRGQASEGES